MSQYTTYDILRKKVDEAKRDIAQLGYPELLKTSIVVGTSNKVTTYLGKTSKRRGFYLIKFNIPYMRAANDIDALSTIYHEVAHCISDGMKHTGRWKACAYRINQAYGLTVSRTTNSAEYLDILHTKEATKTLYTPICTECGEEFRSYTTKTGKVVKSILAEEKRYYCPRCKSTNLRINIQVPQF